MAVTAKMYSNTPHNALEGDIHILTDTVTCRLYTSAVAPTQADTSVAGLTEVANANGYTTGGVTLGAKTCDVTSLTTKFDNTVDPSWTVTGAGFTYRYAVFVDNTNSNKPLCYVDFGADVNAIAGTHTIVLSASGIFTITVA